MANPRRNDATWTSLTFGVEFEFLVKWDYVDVHNDERQLIENNDIVPPSLVYRVAETMKEDLTKAGFQKPIVVSEQIYNAQAEKSAAEEDYEAWVIKRDYSVANEVPRSANDSTA